MGWAEGNEYLRIIHMNGHPVRMGTTFDEGSPPTPTRYYEERIQSNLTVLQRTVRNNRRILYGVMTASEFSNYGEEWWHHDFGNQFDAARTGRPAIYGPARLSAENIAHEEMRRRRYTPDHRSTSQPKAASL